MRIIMCTFMLFTASLQTAASDLSLPLPLPLPSPSQSSQSFDKITHEEIKKLEKEYFQAMAESIEKDLDTWINLDVIDQFEADFMALQEKYRICNNAWLQARLKHLEYKLTKIEVSKKNAAPTALQAEKNVAIGKMLKDVTTYCIAFNKVYHQHGLHLEFDQVTTPRGSTNRTESKLVLDTVQTVASPAHPTRRPFWRGRGATMQSMLDLSEPNGITPTVGSTTSMPTPQSSPTNSQP